LYDQGKVDKRKTGRVVVWWRTGGTPPTPSERTGADQPPTNSDTVDSGVQGDVETSLADDHAEHVDPIDEALSGWSYGRTDEEQAANDTVARASLEWLRETGDAVRQRDVPLGDMAEIDPEDRKEDTLWRTVIRGAWQHADGQGYVERPDSRAYKWAGPTDDVQPDGGIYDPTEEFR